MNGKRGLLWYFTLIIIREQHDRQNPSPITRALQTLDKTHDFSRPQLTNYDRFRLVFLSHFSVFWKQAPHIVQPDTLLRWHCELFRFYWRRKSQGKPKISPETIALIQEMAKENQLWGAERIRSELIKLGIEVSKRTIQRYMPKEKKTGSSSQTWGLS